MSVTFTFGPHTITALLIVRDDLDYESRTIVHNLLGTDTPAVSLLPRLSRAGRLEILFSDPAAAKSAAATLSIGIPFQLTDTDRPDRNMRLVVTGTITTHTDPVTQHRALMTLPFREVPQ